MLYYDIIGWSLDAPNYFFKIKYFIANEIFSFWRNRNVGQYVLQGG
jgi:hypothetical protein